MTYGRNGEFRIPPRAERRHGRFIVPTTGTPIPLFAPVGVTGAAPNELDLTPVALLTAPVAPKSGKHGILLYEWAPAAFAGTDPFLTTYSDRDYAPLGEAVQVIHGTELKLALNNTAESDFLDNRTYAGRTMVAGMGATPTVVVGDLLTPGPGDDVGGYWQRTADETLGWLRIVHIDSVRSEVEVEFTF